MASKTVSLYEARRILDRLEMEKEHLVDILHLVKRDMGGRLLEPYSDEPYSEEAGKAVDINVEGGGTVNVSKGEPRPVMTSEEIEGFRARMQPIKDELEELHTKVVGVQMVLERAELDTQVTIDV